MKKLLSACILLLVSLSPLQLPAAEPQLETPEDVVRFRQDQFEEIKRLYKSLRFEVKRKPFKQERAFRMADEMAELTQPLLLSFKIKDADVKTKARPEIWEEWDRFSQRMKRFVLQTEELADRLREGDVAGAQVTMDELGKACKRCHNRYRYR